MVDNDEVAAGSPIGVASAGFGGALRSRMLLSYLGLLGLLYAASVATAFVSDTPDPDATGESLSVVVCAIGFGLCLPSGARLGRLRYVGAVLCASAAPITALLFHDQLAAQVWSVVPLMFVAVYLRTWHRPAVARAAAAAIALTAVTALVIAPAQVPPLWAILYVTSIVGAAEFFGVMSSALAEAALRDPLTSVWNRAGVDAKAARVIAWAQRRGEPVAVLVLDVDDFKTVNDRDGHAAGDRVLVHLTRRWLARIPKSGVIGRVGGDEFLVVVRGYDESAARALAADLIGGQAVDVTVGVAVGDAVDGALPVLFAAADADLYRRKRRRKNGADGRPPQVDAGAGQAGAIGRRASGLE